MMLGTVKSGRLRGRIYVQLRALEKRGWRKKDGGNNERFAFACAAPEAARGEVERTR